MTPLGQMEEQVADERLLALRSDRPGDQRGDARPDARQRLRRREERVEEGRAHVCVALASCDWRVQAGGDSILQSWLHVPLH